MSIDKGSVGPNGSSSKAQVTRAAWGGLAFLVTVLAVILFVSAGTLRYWQGWLVWLSFTLWVIGITAWFLKHDPALVASRSKVGPVAESRPAQKLYQAVAGAAFLALFIVPGLDHRFGWSHTPLWVVVLGLVMMNAGLAAIAWVMSANSYAASTIQVVDAQKVIDTGPYAWVRHPMYAGALIMLAGLPLALGSWWGLLAAPVMIIAIDVRLLDEERVLRAELSGYTAYTQKTRYRLIPGIW